MITRDISLARIGITNLMLTTVTILSTQQAARLQRRKSEAHNLGDRRIDERQFLP